MIALPSLLGISVVLFTVLALAPGDPFGEIVSNPNIPPEVAANLRQKFGMDDPVVVRELSNENKADAIIACGVILQGETNHEQNLSRSVTDSLQRIAIEHGVPVINVVLSFDNEKQARVRCLENQINRGTEAARAAVEVANVLSEVRRKQQAAGSNTPEDHG